MFVLCCDNLPFLIEVFPPSLSSSSSFSSSSSSSSSSSQVSSLLPSAIALSAAAGVGAGVEGATGDTISSTHNADTGSPVAVSAIPAAHQARVPWSPSATMLAPRTAHHFGHTASGEQQQQQQQQQQQHESLSLFPRYYDGSLSSGRRTLAAVEQKFGQNHVLPFTYKFLVDNGLQRETGTGTGRGATKKEVDTHSAPAETKLEREASEGGEGCIWVHEPCAGAGGGYFLQVGDSCPGCESAMTLRDMCRGMSKVGSGSLTSTRVDGI